MTKAVTAATVAMGTVEGCCDVLVENVLTVGGGGGYDGYCSSEIYDDHGDHHDGKDYDRRGYDFRE